jgi:RNA polymerase sigma factor (sigma-70 family)
VKENLSTLEKETFKILFDKHFDDLRRYLFYRSGNDDLATDLAQDTFLRIWEKQIDIDQKTAKGLLFKIANDLFISRYRKEKTAFNFFSTFEPNSNNLTPEDEINFQQLKDAYETALKTMPEKQRTVFLMNRIDEQTYKEIAQQLNLSVKAIEKRMSQALDHLKKNLKTQITHLVLFIMGLGFNRHKI